MNYHNSAYAYGPPRPRLPHPHSHSPSQHPHQQPHTQHQIPPPSAPAPPLGVAHSYEAPSSHLGPDVSMTGANGMMMSNSAAYSTQPLHHQHHQRIANDLPITVHGTQAGPTRRGPWSPEEDRKLMELISIFGPSNWVRISNSLCTRTPKQCRERYHQNLKPSLNRTPITQEEGILIEKLVAKHGKKWAEIARHLNGRSDNAIKNWWNGGANRRRRASNTIQVKLIDDNSSSGGEGSSMIEDDTPNANSGVSTGTVTPVQIGSSHNKQFSPSVSQSSQLPSLQQSSLQPPLQTLSSGHGFSSGGSSQNAGSTGKPVLKPTQFPQVHNLPQISFNTSMFGSGASSANDRKTLTPPPPAPPTLSAKTTSSIFKPSGLRSASFDINHANPPVLPPLSASTSAGPHMLPTKRRLLDESIPLALRRHSTANTLHTLNNNHSTSHSNLSSVALSSAQNQNSGNVSPYQDSPLMSSRQVSRNNSISQFEFSAYTNHSNTNSSSASRRSSIAPDFFPNPLKDANSAAAAANGNTPGASSATSGPGSSGTGSNSSGTSSGGASNSASGASQPPPPSHSGSGHKRNISQHSFHSPSLTPSTRFSVSSASGLVPLSTNTSPSTTSTLKTFHSNSSSSLYSGAVNNGSSISTQGTNVSSMNPSLKRIGSVSNVGGNSQGSETGPIDEGEEYSSKEQTKISVSSLID